MYPTTLSSNYINFINKGIEILYVVFYVTKIPFLLQELISRGMDSEQRKFKDETRKHTLL